jgi:CRP/FNR family transcriptional regulator, cyclic AMP receptor protein
LFWESKHGSGVRGISSMIDLSMTSAEVRDQIARALPFVRMPDAMERLCDFGELREFPAHSVIQRYCEKLNGLWVVVRGLLLSSYPTSSGKKIIQDVIFPGQASEPTSLIDGMPALSDVVTRTPSVLVCFPVQPLKKLLETEPSLLRGLAEQMCVMRRVSNAVLISRLCISPRGYIAKLLLYWGRSKMTAAMKPFDLPVTLTQDDIAANWGISRATVNKELAQLAREGIVETRYCGITVHDPKRLCAVASEEEPFSYWEEAFLKSVLSANEGKPVSV